MATHTAYSQLFIVYFCHLQDISTQVVRRKRTIGRTSTLLPPTFSSKSSSVSDKLPPSSFGTLESNLDISRPQPWERHPDLQTRHGLVPTCSIYFFHLKNHINYRFIIRKGIKNDSSMFIGLQLLSFLVNANI